MNNGIENGNGNGNRNIVVRAKRLHTTFLRFETSMSEQQRARFTKQITDLKEEIEEDHTDTEEGQEASEYLNRIK